MKTQLAENANWPKEETGESLFSSLLAKPTTLGKEPPKANTTGTIAGDLHRAEAEGYDFYRQQYRQQYRQLGQQRPRREAKTWSCYVCNGRDPDCPNRPGMAEWGL